MVIGTNQWPERMPVINTSFSESGRYEKGHKPRQKSVLGAMLDGNLAG